MKSKTDNTFAWFTVPTLILILVITVIPFALNFYYSLFKWNGVGSHMKFIGLKNFIYILTRDRRFLSSVFFTLKFSVYYVFIVNVLAFVVALRLMKTNFFSNMNRSFIYIPHIISLTAVGLIWSFILGPGFQGLSEKLPFEFLKLSWLGQPALAFYSVIIVAIWRNVGFYMIIYIAGLQSIPQDMLEAASIDGASGWKRLYHITIPMIIPAITICTLTSMMYAFKLFDIILVLTMGGPAGLTNTVAFNIYDDAFARFKFGLATAKSVIFFFGVLVVSMIHLKLMKTKETDA